MVSNKTNFRMQEDENDKKSANHLVTPFILKSERQKIEKSSNHTHFGKFPIISKP